MLSFYNFTCVTNAAYIYNTNIQYGVYVSWLYILVLDKVLQQLGNIYWKMSMRNVAENAFSKNIHISQPCGRRAHRHALIDKYPPSVDRIYMKLEYIQYQYMNSTILYIYYTIWKTEA